MLKTPITCSSKVTEVRGKQGQKGWPSSMLEMLMKNRRRRKTEIKVRGNLWPNRRKKTGRGKIVSKKMRRMMMTGMRRREG